MTFGGVIGTRSLGCWPMRRRNSWATSFGVSDAGRSASSSFSSSLRVWSPLSAMARSSQCSGSCARGALIACASA